MSAPLFIAGTEVCERKRGRARGRGLSRGRGPWARTRREHAPARRMSRVYVPLAELELLVAFARAAGKEGEGRE